MLTWYVSFRCKQRWNIHDSFAKSEWASRTRHLPGTQPAFEFSERQGKIPWRNRAKYIRPGKTPYRDLTNADLQGNSTLYDTSRDEAERVYASLCLWVYATAQSISKRVYLWGCMWPCAPTVGWFVIKGLPRLKEFLSLLNFTISSTFLRKKRSWHKHRIVSFAPLIGNT